MNIDIIQTKVKQFYNSIEYKSFIQKYNELFDTKANCIGINLDKNNNLISIKKYLSLSKDKFIKNNLIPKVPFIENLVKKSLNTETSPCIGLKCYNDKFTKYIHIKCNKQVFLDNKNFFNTGEKYFDSNNADSYGISFEDKKIVKYFYFPKDLTYIRKLKAFDNFDINTLNKIEFVKYKNKSKIIISSSLNFSDNELYPLFKDKFNLNLKAIGHDSEGNKSLYFFK